jgi:hypothetical protein
VTVGRRGVRRTVGLPGTGLFYTSRTGYHTGAHTAHLAGNLPAAGLPNNSPASVGPAARGLGVLILVLGVVLLGVILLVAPQCSALRHP